MTSSTRPAISTIIPTYNGLALLQQHLPAVLAQLTEQDELILADDAGTDASLNWAKEQWQLQPVAPTASTPYQIWRGRAKHHQHTVPVVYLLQNQNVRFAVNVNRAVEIAKHDLIWLLNNDVSPHAHALDRLVPFFDDSTMFAVGSLEEEPQPDGRVVQGGKNVIRFARGMFMHGRAPEFETGPTAWVSGGSGLFSRPKWLSLGGFDERFYPAYWEDIDLSFRAQLKEWRVWFCAESVVTHQHETTNSSALGNKTVDQKSWAHAQYFTWKHSSLFQKILFVCWWPYHTWRLRRLWWP